MWQVILGVVFAVGIAGVSWANELTDELADRYNRSCAVCHLAGVANAPKTGVPADWEQQLAKGMDTLVASVQNGLGAMPPMGMCFDCGPDDFKALIEYMSYAESASSSGPLWTTSFSKDEMTGEISAHAHSPSVYPTKRMQFPYDDARGWLGVGCDNDSEWAYFGFNESPNITDDDTKSGYNSIRTRVKWDDSIETTTLTQTWGARFLHFSDDRAAIQKIATGSEVLLELNWHGQPRTYFKFSLNGSSEALQEIRAKCAE